MKKVIALVLILLLVFSSVVATSALISPTKEDVYVIVIDHSGDGAGYAEPLSVVIGSNGTFTLTAVDGSQAFTKWILEGNYEIIEGNLESRYLVIRPSSDIKATAVFGGGTQGNSDKNSTSPKTGTIPYAIVLLFLAVLASGVAVFVSRKLQKKKD